MITRPRAALGGRTSRKAADAVGRGMADVLAALDNVIDDDAALGRVCARLGQNMPGAAADRSIGTVTDEAHARVGALRPSGAAARPAGPAASRRRLAVRALAAMAAALAAGAVALLVVVVPGAGHGGAGGPVVSTAYVVRRVDGALSAAGPGAIAQMTVTARSAVTSGGPTMATTAEEWSYGDRWRAVTYSAAGHLLYDEGFGTASAYTVVSYRTRTWAREHGLGAPATLAPSPRGCGPVIAALPLLLQPALPGGPSAGWLPATVARDLRAAISCGTLAVAGRQRAGGIETIELASRPDSPISETIWVSPGTYLPVRVVIRPASGQPGPWQIADISWLEPTAQNLARLAVPIPPGFRRVPLAQAVTPNMQRIRL
jgi:hypothetical protein